MQGRATLPPVLVDAAKVQASGLLKDTIILEIPKGTGAFETVLVRRATDKLKEISATWAEYAKQQDDAETVQPLMVLQVPNTPDHTIIGQALDTIFAQYPELRDEFDRPCFRRAHDADLWASRRRLRRARAGAGDADIRMLIAKDAISTGWDCPRAEVMVSFRPAPDKTHITQLLGRMIRTPLARSIPGNERLNSVDCLLPQFDNGPSRRSSGC